MGSSGEKKGFPRTPGASCSSISRPSVTFDEFRRPKGESSKTGTQGLNSIFRLRNFSISKRLRRFSLSVECTSVVFSAETGHRLDLGLSSFTLMNSVSLRGHFLTHLPRTRPPISVSHPACARSYGLRGSSLLSVVSPLKLKQPHF